MVSAIYLWWCSFYARTSRKVRRRANFAFNPATKASYMQWYAHTPCLSFSKHGLPQCTPKIFLTYACFILVEGAWACSCELFLGYRQSGAARRSMYVDVLRCPKVARSMRPGKECTYAPPEGQTMVGSHAVAHCCVDHEGSNTCRVATPPDELPCLD